MTVRTIISTRYTDTKIQSDFCLDSEFLQYLERLIKQQYSSNMIICNYIILLHRVFGGFTAVKRTLKDNNKCVIVIDFDSLPYHNKLAYKAYDNVASDFDSKNYNFVHQNIKDYFTKHFFQDDQSLLLQLLSVVYNGSFGTIFEIFHLMLIRNGYQLPNIIHLSIDCLTEAIRVNIMESQRGRDSLLCYDSEHRNRVYLPINIVELYFILFFNYAESLGDKSMKMTIHHVLFQNYISAFIPIRDWMNLSEKIKFGPTNIPLLTYPENFLYMRHVENSLKKVSTYTSEFEYFISTLSLCFIPEQINKSENILSLNNVRNNCFQSKCDPSLSLLNFVYQISYRILISYKNIVEYRIYDDNIINVTFNQFYNFIKIFLLKSLISANEYNKIKSIIETWLLFINPQKIWSKISPSSEKVYIRFILPLYIYGYYVILTKIETISDLQMQLQFTFPLLDNYQPKYFQTIPLETCKSINFNNQSETCDFVNITGYELEHCFLQIFHSMGRLYRLFKSINISSLQHKQHSDTYNCYKSVLLMIHSILQSWSVEYERRNLTFDQLYTIIPQKELTQTFQNKLNIQNSIKTPQHEASQLENSEINSHNHQNKINNKFKFYQPTFTKNTSTIPESDDIKQSNRIVFSFEGWMCEYFWILTIVSLIGALIHPNSYTFITLLGLIIASLCGTRIIIMKI